MTTSPPVGGLVPNAFQQFLDGNGVPLANGSVYFYVPGTTTLKTTWQDSALSVPNTNPVLLDGDGMAAIWGLGNYTQTVFNSDGVQEWSGTTGAGNVGSATIGSLNSWTTLTTGLYGLFVVRDATLQGVGVWAGDASGVGTLYNNITGGAMRWVGGAAQFQLTSGPVPRSITFSVTIAGTEA